VSGFRPRFFVDGGALAPSQDDDGVPSAQDDSVSVGTELTLSAGDSHHALRVLRLQPGDACEVVVGAAVYAATVSGAKTPVTVKLNARLLGAAAGAAYRFQVGLVQALLRPMLLDQVLEKGTEVGASFFVLFPAAESARLPESARAGRLERWRRIVVEAAKQSKRLSVPTVRLADSLTAALEGLTAQGALSLVLDPDAPVSLRDRLEAQMGPGSLPGGGEAASVACLVLWVGPESGWSEAEREQFAAAGIEAARLGQSVLRAETAGPVAVAATRLVLRDW